MNSERIPAPKVSEVGAEYVALWTREQAVLNSDPRTAGDGTPRPTWMVERVLRENGIDPNALRQLRHAHAATVPVSSKLAQAFADAAWLDSLTGK